MSERPLMTGDVLLPRRTQSPGTSDFVIVVLGGRDECVFLVRSAGRFMEFRWTDEEAIRHRSETWWSGWRLVA
jgi:chemotaxis signal transduction protein